MKIKLDLKKTLEQNAEQYFEKAKKARKKAEGAEKAVRHYQEKLASVKKETPAETNVVKKKPAKKWYEKYRWFMSSDNLPVIGGRDATTNEMIIKKHTEKNDLVFHTDMTGSPFVIVKNKENNDIPETTKKEAATFTAVFSKAWKKGLGTLDVFSVKPEQVSKNAKPGEYLAKGAFMIYGDTDYYHPEMSHAIGIYQGRVMGGPLSAIKKHCNEYVEVVQGRKKQSDIAKKIKKKLGAELDDILRALPTGCRLKK